MKNLILIVLLSIGCSKATSESKTEVVIEKPICDKITVNLDETLVGYIKKVKISKHTTCYVFFDEDGGSVMDCLAKGHK